MISQLTSNWICWLMVMIALAAYQQIFVLFLQRKEEPSTPAQHEQRKILPDVLVASLPLMGLFGTIVGLQASFTGMMSQGVDSQVVSGGIADALLTTQLGLILAIPGWLAMLTVNSAIERAQLTEASQYAQ